MAWAYQQEPFSAIWAVRDTGDLLCFTWEQEQQVWGWTLCETDGLVKDVCVITENGWDRLYLAVERTINGVTSVFIELMALPLQNPDDLPIACHLDCSIAFERSPSVGVDGLEHLEGATVSALADGVPVSGLVVTNGHITLPNPAGTVVVGLPYLGTIETLPLTVKGQEGEQNAKRQDMNRAIVRVVNTAGLIAGPRGGDLHPLKLDQPTQPTGLVESNDYLINLDPSWSGAATVLIRQNKPMPATITAVFLEPEFNL